MFPSYRSFGLGSYDDYLARFARGAFHANELELKRYWREQISAEGQISFSFTGDGE